MENNHSLLMDRAYEDDETRALAEKQEFVPVIPPKLNRKNLGIMNVVMKLKDISSELNVLEKFLLVITNLILSILLLFILLLFLMLF